MREMMREEYTRLCENIFDLLMSGVSEDAPVIQDLRKTVQALNDEYGFDVLDDEE